VLRPAAAPTLRAPARARGGTARRGRGPVPVLTGGPGPSPLRRGPGPPSPR